jgi:hypothetical protein
MPDQDYFDPGRVAHVTNRGRQRLRCASSLFETATSGRLVLELSTHAGHASGDPAKPVPLATHTSSVSLSFRYNSIYSAKMGRRATSSLPSGITCVLSKDFLLESRLAVIDEFDSIAQARLSTGKRLVMVSTTLL